MTAQPAANFDPRRPFGVVEAAAAGIPERRLRTRSYQRIFNGVYVAAAVPITPELRAVAALVPFEAQAYLSHASAARVYGAPIPAIADEFVTVRHPSDRRRRPGIVCRAETGGQIYRKGNVRLSGPDQLFAELATLLQLIDLVAVGDWLVRKEYTTPERLVAFCARRRGAGAELARRAAAYVRERVDSPMETLLRMLIVLAGLPEPVVNLTLRSEIGEPVRRHDLCYPGQRIAIEYNGRVHLSADNAEADSDRREDSDNDGWRTLVVFSRGIYVEPQRTVERIWRVARERKVPGTPVRPRDDWRPHFPGRGS